MELSSSSRLIKAEEANNQTDATNNHRMAIITIRLLNFVLLPQVLFLARDHLYEIDPPGLCIRSVCTPRSCLPRSRPFPTPSLRPSPIMIRSDGGSSGTPSEHNYQGQLSYEVEQ